jgi:hypothetical protein
MKEKAPYANGEDRSSVKQLFILCHEVRHVQMMHTFSFLKKGIEREEITRISVPDESEWSIFPIFHIRVRNAQRHLYVCILVSLASDEIALKLSDSSNCKLVAMRAEIDIERIFKRRTIVQAYVDIPCKVDARISQVIFLFAF